MESISTSKEATNLKKRLKKYKDIKFCFLHKYYTVLFSAKKVQRQKSCFFAQIPPAFVQCIGTISFVEHSQTKIVQAIIFLA